MASKAVLILAIAVAAAACVLRAQAKLGTLVITGVVPCNTGTLIDIATSPAFPDANVELRCGGNTVAGARTSSNGSFTIKTDLTNALSVILGGCKLVVDTPLVKCHADLPPAGTLESYLQGPLTGLIDSIFPLTPAGFSFFS